VLAVIAAAAGRDCGHHIAGARRIVRTTGQSGCASFAIRPTRDSRTDAALAIPPSLFRFPSVARGPRFSHDPVNLAPDCDG
jgi:hypothetical protein